MREKAKVREQLLEIQELKRRDKETHYRKKRPNWSV